VQFHPELMIYRAPFRRLFKALVDAAGARCEERRAKHGLKQQAAAKTKAAPAVEPSAAEAR
jgi:hypothetical protein